MAKKQKQRIGILVSLMSVSVLAFPLTTCTLAVPAYTPTPTRTPVSPPTSTLLPTATSVYMDMSTYTSTPNPTRVAIPMQVQCETVTENIVCYDPLLHVEFSYPVAWGDISATLFQGSYSGWGYNYQFSEFSSMLTGGKSSDFSAPRGGFITGFGGFGTRSIVRMCDIFGNAICEQIQDRVLFGVNVTLSASFCNEGPPPFYYSPIGIVMIDLPEYLQIQGFIFVLPLLSQEKEEELRILVSQCDQTNQEQFDARISEIVKDIQLGALEGRILENYQAMYDLANSIKFQSND